MGVDALSTWRDMVAWALAAMFLFTASAYFMRTRGELVAMVPRAFPNPGLLVSVTGILKGLGAVGPVGLLILATGDWPVFARAPFGGAVARQRQRG